MSNAGYEPVGAFTSRLQTNPDLAESLENALAANRALGTHIFSDGKFQFIIGKNVFSPLVFKDTVAFTRRLALGDIALKDEDMLEIGCGSGFTGLWLLKQCGLRSLVATDINPAAVECTKLNGRNLGVDKKLVVVQGDVFDSIPGDRKFGIIYWNHPWEFRTNGYQYPDILSRSVYDREYEGLTRYIRGASSHLREKGRLFLGFGDSGDELTALKSMADAHGYKADVIERFSGEANFGAAYALYELRR